MTGVLKRRWPCEDKDNWREENQVTKEAEIAVVRLKAKERHGSQERGVSRFSPSVV